MEDFVAGWFGGCAGVIVGQPMDTIKVRMQAMDASSIGKSHSFRKILYKTIKHETVSGLFKGMVPPLTAIALQNGILFCVYGNILKQFEVQVNGSYAPSHVAIAGLVGGFAQCFIVCPLDLVKIKLQMQTEAKRKHSFYHGPIDCIKKIYKVRGIPGFFQGMTTTIYRDVPGFGVYFGVNELVSRWLSKYLNHNSAIIPLTSGGMAGVISWMATFPFDVTKSRLQADGNRGNFKYSGVIDCMVKSYRAEGVGVFSRGLLPTVVRAFPSNAAIMYTYTFCLRLLHKKDVSVITEEIG